MTVLDDSTLADGGGDSDDEAVAPSEELVAKKKHSLPTRWMHWINFPVLLVMVYSGMRIYWADLRDPFVLGIGPFEIFTFWPDGVNSFFQLERRLARGLAFHLVFGWIFVLNGAAYVVYLARKGRWRAIVPDRRGLRDVGKVILHDLHLRKEAPPQGKYNAMQQLTYTAVLVTAGLLVASGFAIYKPVQLSWLTWILGGYEFARFIHFSMTILLMLFFVVHVIQVMRSGWSNFASMITGYRVERRRVAPDAAADVEVAEEVSA